MKRLVPLLGVLLAIGASIAATVGGHRYLAGNFARQRAALDGLSAKLQQPVAPGRAHPHRTAEVWLSPTEVIVNLTSMPELQASAVQTQRVRSIRRTWQVTRLPFPGPNSSEHYPSTGADRTVMVQRLDRDLAWVGSMSPYRSDAPDTRVVQLRLRADGRVPWEIVRSTARRAEDAQVKWMALGMLTPENTRSDHYLQRYCNQLVDLHITPEEVWLTQQLAVGPPLRKACSGADCPRAASEILRSIGMQPSLCLTPAREITVDQVAELLTLIDGLSLHPVLVF